MVRAGFRMLLSREPDIEVVAEASNGLEAVDKAARFRPTVVLMDIRMPELDGLEATRRILAADPAARILILTTFDLDEYVYEALRAGASGFVLKDDPPEQLLAAIRIVAGGDALLSPARHEARDQAVHAYSASRASAGARRADRARAGCVPADRPRPLERRDRPGALHQRHDGEDAHHPHPPEARPARPRPGGRARLPDRARRRRHGRPGRSRRALEPLKLPGGRPVGRSYLDDERSVESVGMASHADRQPVRLAELVAALSLGIDLGFGQPMEHVLRQCLIALRLAERIGLDEESRAVVYYTALLVSVGCHTDAHEQAKWFGDDIALKSIKYEHGPGRRAIAASMRMIGSGNPPLHRFRIGLEFALSGRREVDAMINHHAALAVSLAEQLGLPDAVLEAVGCAYEQWDGRGWPGRRAGTDVPLAARLAGLADFVEVAYRVGGVDAARDLARRRRGKQFDPALADVICDEGDMILAGLDDVGTWDAVIDAEPALAVAVAPDALRRDAAGGRELRRPEVAVQPRPRRRRRRPGRRRGAAAGHVRRCRRRAAARRPGARAGPPGHLQRDLGQAAARSAPASGSGCACTRT